jgi:WbqC-like protein family
MTKVVISQPMYFPWYGHLEQIKHCDIYVFYDDAQFSKGSFFNRVQLKDGERQTWMTIPLEPGRLNQAISQRLPLTTVPWRQVHESLFERLYKTAPYYGHAREALMSVLGNCNSADTLASISEASTKALAEAFDLDNTRYLRSSEIGISGSGSRRVLDICRSLGASEYITGHGAKNYLDHKLFADSGIEVKYIAYGMKPYPQHSGKTFIPFVSSLDCLANCGKRAGDHLSGSLVSWREFIGGNQS